ncbi:hypothetical protein MCUN1_002685 [Malassezia cuniculi]|uniref:Uncharacterized protein n=1 Tax=Malassezia cuniculi TaxID=948313 RepID=A0AAF0J6R1_9BASI|nr:hypothetical protein MCUN1_002685 [Malassezia cuniculi]
MGGPSLGDIRSRLMRLAALSQTQRHERPLLSFDRSTEALHTLLSYRLPTIGTSRDVRQEWMDIIEGKHHLWNGIDAEKRECVRGFLVQFESEVLQRAHRGFNFRGGSIGNFFLCAMQRFFRSIQSAIFLFSAVTDIPVGLPQCQVLPAINTNNTTTIAALLRDRTVLMGQCEISHPPMAGADAMPPLGESGVLPSRPSIGHNIFRSENPSPLDSMDEADWSDEDQRPLASIGGTRGSRSGPMRHESFSLGNIVFNKQEEMPLPAPIERVYYVNTYGNEVFPQPNDSYLLGIERSNTLIYSCGSLWTSIVPCLALRGLARAIARSRSLKRKVLILNGVYDRETNGMTATDFVRVITGTLNHANDPSRPNIQRYAVDELVTHVIYPANGEIQLNVDELTQLGVQCVPVQGESSLIDANVLRSALELI